MGSHTGTHVDAYSHMHKGNGSLDDIPVERFLGKAQVVELSGEWPKELGLFFIEEIGLKYLNIFLKGFINNCVFKSRRRV